MARIERRHIALLLRATFLITLAVSCVIAVFEDRKEVARRGGEGRALAEPPPPNLTFGAETVRDSITNLEWTREVAPTRLRWDDAKAYCATLGTAGGGFRLPARDELMSVMRFPKDPFDGEPDWYWSASIGVREGTAWAVGGGAWLNGNPTSTLSRARCVRAAR